MREESQNPPLLLKTQPVQNTGEASPVLGVFSVSKLVKKPPFLGSHLGIYAKSSARQQPRGLQPEKQPKLIHIESVAFEVDFSTGEILQEPSKYDPVSVRLERFALQSAARRLLPESRTAKCLQIRQKGVDKVVVKRSISHKSAFYTGLQTCSSVWNCPVCASKISERRRIELLFAIDAHEGSGGQVLLLTLTNPHSRTDNLQAMLKAQALAMSRFNGDKAARLLFSSIGCIGTVRAWEVTHGDNGWHPHFHLLLFVDSGLDLVALRADFYALWANCCRLAGLPIPSFEHGVRLDDGSKASEYVSKGLWGLDREMTKGHIKKAKKGRSPFDLLRSYMVDKDKQAGALFIEYATAFKGKRQLFWSKGLKDHFHIDDETDESIAERVDDDAQVLGFIDYDDWLLILLYELRGLLLELARHGWDAVERCLVGLRKNEGKSI